MYSGRTSTWLKHWDFILLDLIVYEFSFYVSHFIRNGIKFRAYGNMYFNVGLVMGLSMIAISFFMEAYSGILRRDHFSELKKVFAQVMLVIGFMSIYIYFSGYGPAFSKFVFVFVAVLTIPLDFILRTALKLYLRKNNKHPKRAMLLVTSSDIAERVATKMMNNLYNEYEVKGVILVDTDKYANAYAARKIVAEGIGGAVVEGTGIKAEDVDNNVVLSGTNIEIPMMDGTEQDLLENDADNICGIPVVCTFTDIFNFMQNRWVDEVFVYVSNRYEVPEDFFDGCLEMGITTHLNLSSVEELSRNLAVEKIGGYVVLTNTIQVASTKQIVAKRTMDFLGSLVGLVFCLFFGILVGPLIFIKSPGPIIFSQERVGKNGKRFRLYKFRSMYLDAEARKEALMDQNKMQGHMFKVDNDPRIIGSGPDGTKHGIGWFIRKTSIDEFPQFWNVLKGDMSLVGTRPPTVDEWKQYEAHHRARLAVKPGITGLWQISGRSDITDFEEVVALDLQYMKNWSIGTDIEILWKTVLAVLQMKGSE
ncbi:MAG: sugar transferase [Lachnospiraceae bacterium]|nr:sugar transferase [Lachnospiraceae bacterium]